MIAPAVAAFFLAAAACPAHDRALVAAAEAVEGRYITAAEGREIAAQIREWRRSGRYRQSCAETAAFVEEVNRDLDVLDPHFLLERPAAEGAQPAEDWLTAWRAESRTVNAGVREARVLEGNVGYLRISSFYPWDLARPKLDAALRLVSDADGLIIDLRGNGGGDATTPAHIVRALLGPDVRAVQAIESRAGRTHEPLPALALPAVRASVPVVVLIDRRSASASEYVAYSLQAAGRATIVGGRSGGVANMLGEPVPLTDGFALSIPESRPVNLITGGNWEGVGTRPDIPGGDDPLHVARRRLEKPAS